MNQTNPALQIETIALLGLMKTWAKNSGSVLERKATGLAIADGLGSSLSRLQVIPLTTDDVAVAAKDSIAVKEAIEVLFKVAQEKRDNEIGNQVLRLVIGFNTLTSLYDLLAIETGKDVFGDSSRSMKKQEHPLDQLRRLFGGME